MCFDKTRYVMLIKIGITLRYTMTFFYESCVKLNVCNRQVGFKTCFFECVLDFLKSHRDFQLMRDLMWTLLFLK